MTDFVEMFRHWNAGRSQVQIHQALGIDRKTIRKYLAPALAEGLVPCPDRVFDEPLWRARIGRWFPELVDPAARALTWPQIAAHHQWITDQLKVPVTVATIAQRLRDDHGVDVSESTVRRYITITFADQGLEERVTVPRGAVEPGSEAQIDYGRLGMWWDPTSGQLHSWYFDSRGGFGEGQWTRDGNSWKIAAGGIVADGRTGTSTNIWKFVDNKTISWISKDRELGGVPMPENEVKFVRKSEEPKTTATSQN